MDPSALRPIMSVSVCQYKPGFPLSVLGQTLTILAAPLVILEPWALVWRGEIAHVPHNRESRRARETTSTPPGPV